MKPSTEAFDIAISLLTIILAAAFASFVVLSAMLLGGVFWSLVIIMFPDSSAWFYVIVPTITVFGLGIAMKTLLDRTKQAEGM